MFKAYKGKFQILASFGFVQFNCSIVKKKICFLKWYSLLWFKDYNSCSNWFCLFCSTLSGLGTTEYKFANSAQKVVIQAALT